MKNKRFYAVLVLAVGIVLAVLHMADLLQWMDASTGFALRGSVWARYLPWLAALALPYLPARQVAAQPTELADTNLPLGCCMLMVGALLLGSGLLQRFQPRRVFGVSCVLMLVALGGLIVLRSEMALYACIGLIGLGNSNIFPIIFAQALQHSPRQANAVSALMIMGLIGGTVFPLLMGAASDAVGQQGAVAVMVVAALYLCFLQSRMKCS